MYRAYEDCKTYQRALAVSNSQKAAFESAENAQTVNTVYITTGYPEWTIAFKNPSQEWTIRG